MTPVAEKPTLGQYEGLEALTRVPAEPGTPPDGGASSFLFSGVVRKEYPVETIDADVASVQPAELSSGTDSIAVYLPDVNCFEAALNRIVVGGLSRVGRAGYVYVKPEVWNSCFCNIKSLIDHLVKSPSTFEVVHERGSRFHVRLLGGEALLPSAEGLAHESRCFDELRSQLVAKRLLAPVFDSVLRHKQNEIDLVISLMNGVTVKPLRHPCYGASAISLVDS